jgi:hypothetical protein
MPIGTRRTLNGVTYRQTAGDLDLCPGAPDACSVCWNVVEPATLAELLRSETIEAAPTEIPVMGEAKRKSRAKAYVHVEPRVLNATVTDRAAKCCNCGDMRASEDSPLVYCYTAGHVGALDLVCSSCRDAAFSYCRAEDCYAYEIVRVEGMSESYYSLYYAQMHFVQRGGTWFASSAAMAAYDASQRMRNPVYGYHATNPIERHGWPVETQDYELCFGVELEMERRGAASTTGRGEMSEALGGRDGELQALRDAGVLQGRYILATDGSLNATGVELITSPYTLEFHQSKFGWPALLEQVKTIGMSGKGTDRCGMHVHCNRQAISALTLGKMLVFANSTENKLLIERIAQRDSSFARKSPKKVIDGKRVRGDGKYEALNITQNTIECRIFRGNLRPERVLKNIEFCHAMITYCQTASIADCHTFTDFIAWLGKHRGSYKHLVKFLAPHYNYKLTREDTTGDI